MSDLAHSEVRELSGAAAVGALTVEEVARVRSHLAECARCRAEYAELEGVAQVLLRVPEPVAPPPELRERILAAAAMPEGASATDEAPSPQPSPRGRGGIGQRRWWDWRDLGIVASLAAALFFGWSTWRVQSDYSAAAARLAQQEQLVRAATTGRVVALSGTPAAPQVRAAVAEAGGQAHLYMELLPTPPTDRAYQVWLIPPGAAPIGVGLTLAGQGGTQSVTLARALAGMQTIAVTLEPATGSPGPTTPVLAAGQLSPPIGSR